MFITAIYECDADQKTIYTVELDAEALVDIAVTRRGLIYVMQNHDGSEVYDSKGNSVEFPYKEEDVLRYVHQQAGRCKSEKTYLRGDEKNE